MKKLLIALLLVGVGWDAKSCQADTLTYDNFLEWVSSYHPLAAQAELFLRMGNMEVRAAKGGFDPTVYGNLDKKSYDEKTYYDKREAGISVPTWGGVELTGIYEQNSGKYLNPENNVPSGGLFAAGASVNLGQGLLLDERRVGLRKAQIYQESTESERAKLLNELYLQATEAYWNWSLAYANLILQSEGAALAEARFEAVKISYELGDFPAIDTVEAATQLLNRQYNLQKAENGLYIKTQELNVFLWNEEGKPISLDETIVPELINGSEPLGLNEAELRSAVLSHPDLKLADYELASLAIERRFKAQQILPVIKLKYNFLTTDLNGFDHPGFFENNYKWGLSVYTPLLWRKARGSTRLAEAKIDFKQNSRDLKAIQLRAKLENELNSYMALNSQINTFAQNVEALEMLLSGELRRFEIGESSLFLVNSREVSVFNSRLTLNELLIKRRIAFAKTRYAAGLGFDDF